MSQTHYTQFIHDAVGSTLTDFTVLISVTDARLKSVANGGHVAGANGYDIRPYSDSGLSSAITGYKLVYYNATTGLLIMKVKRTLGVATVSTYLGYGDAALNTDGSATSVFDANVKACWEFGDGTTLSLADQSAGGVTLTNNGTATAVAGKVGGGVSLVRASSQYLSAAMTDPGMALTYRCWFKPTTVNVDQVVIDNHPASVPNVGTRFSVTSAAHPQFTLGGVADYPFSGLTLVAGTWYFLAITISGNNGTAICYLAAAGAGSLSTASSAIGTRNPAGTPDAVVIGNDTFNEYANGVIDAMVVVGAARSADWLTAEFLNQDDPSAFNAIQTEVALSGTAAAVTGTGGSGMSGAEVRTGGKTLILTLTGDTFVAAGATFDAQRQAIIDGIVAASSPTWGWNNTRSAIPVTAVVRTSNTVCTITLPALSGYQSDTTETLTVTIPSTAVALAAAIVATPTVAIARTVADLTPVDDYDMTGTATRTRP